MRNEKTVEYWAHEFILAKNAEAIRPATIEMYRSRLAIFLAYCSKNNINTVEEISSETLKDYFSALEEDGHNKGGLHFSFRIIRAFLHWWEKEVLPDDWRNPLNRFKLKYPEPEEKENPFGTADVDKMLAVCDQNTFIGRRDAAILLFLVESGIKFQELVELNHDSYDRNRGTLMIKTDKIHGPAPIQLAPTTMMAFLKYSMRRTDNDIALWTDEKGNRLKYSGIRQIIRKRATQAGIKVPGASDIQQIYLQKFLRSKIASKKWIDEKEMGYISRHMKLTDAELKNAHDRSGPLDHLTNKK